VIKKRMTNTANEPYLDGRARYQARVRGPDGKLATRTFTTMKAAQGWERDKFNEKDHGAWVALAGGRIRLRDFATEWIDGAVDLAPSTRRIYRSNLRLHILPVLGELPLGALTPELCDRWLAGLRRKQSRRGPLAPASAHQAYRTLNRVLVVATKARRIARNPLNAVDPPKVTEKEMRFLDHEEVACLAAAVGDRHRAFVLVAAYCGPRAGELRGLRRRDIDLLHRTITVTQQLVDVQGGGFEFRPLKTRRSRRSIAVPPHVAEALDFHLSTPGCGQPGRDGLVFTSPTGEPMHLENFRRRVWSPACLEAGIAPLRIHDLRHTCASLAIAAGADILVLQRMLGHASAAMTLDRYGHLMPGQAESVAQRLSAAASEAVQMSSSGWAAPG
jgi:integrase